MNLQAFALTVLTAATVIAGFEQETGLRKLNPGVLMSTAQSEFLQLWRASWANYSSRDWDYNCCQVAYRLHEALTERLHTHIRADLGPLPRYNSEAEYDAHLERARVVHVTALSQPWRKRDSKRYGIMEKVSALVLKRINATASIPSLHGGVAMTELQRRCFETTAMAMRKKHGRRIEGTRGGEPW